LELLDRSIISFDLKTDSKALVSWLYDQNRRVALELERLLQDKGNTNFEALLFSNAHD
jgi:hypothetical protein